MTPLLHSETITTLTAGWGSNPLAGFGFVYDSSSRIASIDSYIDGLSEYTHDDTNQLVGADHNTADDEAYEYDANGNRIMSGYDIDPNNQLYSDGTYIYTYDAEGNRETRTKISNSYVTRYYWDHRNRMTKVEEYDAGETHLLSSVEQTYDPLNQWIRRSFDEDGTGGDPAVDTFFVYENGQIVLEFDGDDDSDLSHRYTWGENVDQLFADETVTSLGSTGTVIWPVGDHLGTLRDLIAYDAGMDDAAVANHREIDSYGNITDESNSAVDELFGFTSRPLDETTGLQNNLNRWYEAANGIWITADPIGFNAGDPNLIRYIWNAPLSGVDANGLAPTPPQPSSEQQFNEAADLVIDNILTELGKIESTERFSLAAESVTYRFRGWPHRLVSEISFSLEINRRRPVNGLDLFIGIDGFERSIENAIVARMFNRGFVGKVDMAWGLTSDERDRLNLDYLCPEEIIDESSTEKQSFDLGDLSRVLIKSAYDYLNIGSIFDPINGVPDLYKRQLLDPTNHLYATLLVEVKHSRFVAMRRPLT